MIEKRNLYHSQDYDVPFRHPKKLHARAIYDNIADSPEELAFKKGEVLNVIEQDPDGMAGWWLCTVRGRQGLCPGNRLRILNSYDSGCFTPSPSSSPSPSLGASTASVSSAEIYDTATLRSGKRRSWYITPHKVVTPQKCGDVYLYDISPSSRNSPYQNLSTMSDPEAYDIPRPSATQMNYDCPKNWSKPQPKETNLRQDDSYDTPRPATSLSQQNMTPSSSNSSLMTPDNLSLSSSNRSSLATIPDYDIPRRNPVRATPHQQQQNSLQQSQSTYDFPQQIQKYQQNGQEKNLPPVNKELPLELASALETLAKLQNEATAAVTRLLAFVVPNWRSREKLEPVLMDVKLAAVRLKTALHDLAEFGEGTLGNATRAEDKSLAHKLKPLVKALRDADKLIHEASQNLELYGWTLDTLSRKDQKSSVNQPPDSLDQLVACAQTLTEDVRQSASFIQGNATLLFKRVSLTPIVSSNNNNNNNNGNGEWIEDNDYVSLESKDAAAKKNSELREAIPHNLKKKFDNAIKAAEETAINSDKIELNTNDKLLIKYYAVQISTHMGYLTQAIDSFLETVEKNQPPKFFIAYGKFVVLSAHNLVSIGDIVHRNISRDDIKSQVQKYTDGLSDALKTCVLKSKKAAQHFPSVNAVQEMVDSVVDISHLAYDLKTAMLQSVQA